jgi:hypothetical protein
VIITLVVIAVVFILVVLCLLRFKNPDSLKLSARCSFVSFNFELATRRRDNDGDDRTR